MRITIIPVALFLSAVIFLGSCNPALAYENDIGQSKIHPASPLYFLKSVREILELKFAGTTHVRAIRQMEFAHRRLREVNSLVQSNRQDLIAPNLERYWSHLRELIGIVNLRDESLAREVSGTAISHLTTLLKVYDQITDPRAKMSVRTTIFKLSEWDEQLISKFNQVTQEKYAQKVIPSRLSACNFLSKEASSSALNETEKVVLLERARKCLEIKK